MKQHNLFDDLAIDFVSPVTTKKKYTKVTGKIVFYVIQDIKKKKSNKEIIEFYKLKDRTFFRIKKGEYNHLLEQYVDETVSDFSLELTD